MNSSLTIFDSFQNAVNALALSDVEVQTLMRATDNELKGEWTSAMIQRAAYLISIYSSLHGLLRENPNQANTWVRRSNTHFKGNPAINVMLRDDKGLEQVYKYLKAQCV